MSRTIIFEYLILKKPLNLLHTRCKFLHEIADIFYKLQIEIITFDRLSLKIRVGQNYLNFIRRKILV